MRCGDELRAVRLDAGEVLDVSGCTTATSEQRVVVLETSVEDGIERQRIVDPEAACDIPPVHVPLFACINGLVTAAVDPVAGASYEWSAEGATIVGDATANRAVFRVDEKSATLRCSVTTEACGSSDAVAVVAVREPIDIRGFVVPAESPANQPLTLSWSYVPGHEPRSQALTGDLFPEPVFLPAAERSYTFTPQTGGTRTVELRASHSEVVPIAPRPKRRRRSVSGGVSASECPGAVATAKIEIRGCAGAEPLLEVPFDAAAGSAFVASVIIADGETVEWSVENGTVQSVSPFYDQAMIVAGSSGTTKVTARVERAPGCFATATASVPVILPAAQCAIPPAASLTYVGHDCQRATMRATFTGTPPFAGEWSDGTPFRTSAALLHQFSSPGTYTIRNFRDASCFGSVNGEKTLETLRPRVDLRATPSCGVTNLVATLKGVPPFTLQWSDGPRTTTSDTIVTRAVPGDPQGYARQVVVYVRDAACSSLFTTSDQVTIAPPIVARYGDWPHCQTDPAYGTNIVATFSGGTGPYLVEWSDGVSVVSAFDTSVRRQVGPITGPSAQYEIVRATAGACEVEPTHRIATVLNRPSAVIRTPTDTWGCTGEVMTATLSRVPLPEATLLWSLTNHAPVLSGQGTPSITFTADSPGTFALTVKTTYPDGSCTTTSPKVSYAFVQRRTLRNIRLIPQTIQRGGSATVTWDMDGTPSNVKVTTTPEYGTGLRIDGCCGAIFTDKVRVAATVPITVSWDDSCDGPKQETVMLTIAP